MSLRDPVVGRAAVAFLAAVMVFVGCAVDDEPTVRIVDRRFSPAQIVIEPNTRVVWVNNSSEVHTVTADQDSIPVGARYFSSAGATSEQGARSQLAKGLLTKSESYEFFFEAVGTYRYFCIPHQDQGMKGTVVVRRGG